jgi:hypothetical protein
MRNNKVMNAVIDDIMHRPENLNVVAVPIDVATVILALDPNNILTPAMIANAKKGKEFLMSVKAAEENSRVSGTVMPSGAQFVKSHSVPPPDDLRQKAAERLNQTAQPSTDASKPKT